MNSLIAETLIQTHAWKFATLYLLVGVASFFILSIRGLKLSVLDTSVLFVLWPLYAPLLLMGKSDEGPGPQSKQAEAFLAALRRAEGTPLARLLPDLAEINRLSQRLNIASAKIIEIDQLLSRPAFSRDATLARVLELQQKKASERAVASAQLRVQHIERLQAIKHRFVQELDEVEELLAQFTAQAEVARLAGSTDHAASELVKELLQRVDAFGQALDEMPTVA
jgi:hypothetical protein